MQAKFKIAEDSKSITCLNCNRTSFNINDVKMRYCAACHLWLDECCDFCGQHNDFVKDYIAEMHITGILNDGRPLEDKNHLWAACSLCSTLIEAQDWEGLIQRVMETHQWNEKNMRPRVIFMYQAVFGEKFTVTE